MELRNIISFLKIAELSSFSKTAEELGYSQSNITMQIKQLEFELNTRLFDRIGKSVSLTESGRIFQTYALEAVNSLDNAVHALSSETEPSGEVRIGLLESLCITYLPTIIQEYHKRYPNVNTVIRIGTYEELEVMLNHNEIDLLWVFNQPIECPDWINAFTYSNPIRIIAATDSKFAGHTITLQDLSGQSFILTESNCSYQNQFVQKMQQNSVPFHIFLEIGNTEIIKKFVQSNLALSVLPQFAVEQEIRSNTLSCLEVEDFQVTMYGQFFYHKEKWVTPAMYELIQLIKHLFFETQL